LSKARRLRLAVGTFLLALAVVLTGCSGRATQEEKKEKMKMLEKREETDKVEKTEKE
jgi:PBP1b-binding outer membrane lipoprotein LpoB